MANQERSSAELYRRARFFYDTGYLKIPVVLKSDQTATLRKFVLEEEAKDKVKEAIRGQIAHKIYGLYDRNPELMHSLLTNPKLVSELTGILGPNVVFVKNRHNHATTNRAMSMQVESRLHRDVLQPKRGLLTAIFYLENSTEQNGCTTVIPGSQRLDYVGVPQSDGGGTWMDEHEEFVGINDQELLVPMPEGGVLLFDGLTFHRVGINTTELTRMSITLAFRSVDELSQNPDFNREVLVSGQYLYCGNDISTE